MSTRTVDFAGTGALRGAFEAPRSFAPTFEQRARAVAAFTVLAVGLGLLYYGLAMALERAGYASNLLLFLGEKAQLALHGAPPRLVNLGFIYPPLSFALVLPFGDPFVAQAATSGALVAATIRFIEGRELDPTTRRLLEFSLVLSPVVLYHAVEDFGALLFAVLFAAALRSLARYLDRRLSLDLFAGGILFALAFFVDFRSSFAIVLVVPAMAMAVARRSLAHAGAVMLAVSLPVAFFACTWAYINWLFLGDPLAFVHGRGSIFATYSPDAALLAVSGDPLRSLLYLARDWFATLPLTLAYAVGFVLLVWRARGRAPRAALAALYLAPLAAFGMAIYFGAYHSPAILVVACTFTFVAFVERFGASRQIRAAILVSLAASFVPVLADAATRTTALETVLYRGAVTGNLGEYRAIATVVADATPNARILADDTFAFGAVWTVGAPDRFILPYQYEFDSALSHPSAFARYVVAARTPDDKLYALYPGIETGRLAGFREILRTEHFTVLERTSEP